MARPRLITDAQILSTMRTCVLEHGAGVSLDVVAHKLGVTSPALLKRFGNREGLMVAALKPPENPAWVARLAGGPDERPLEAQLADLVQSLWDFFNETIPCIAALRESGIPHERIFGGKRHAAVGAIKALAAWVSQAHARGLVEAAAPEAVASAILGSLQIRVFTAHVTKTHLTARSNREYLDDLVDLFTRALAPSRGARRRTAPGSHTPS